MPTLLLRGSLVRPHLEAILGLSRAHGRSDIRRRKQSSSTSSTSSPSPHPSETAAQTQARTTPTHPEPHIVQQVTGQAKPQARIEDPIPGPNTVGPLPFWQRLGPLTRAGQAYARAQRARPWATQVASALVVYLAADFGAQQMGGSGGVVVGEEEGAQVNERRHDWGRTVRSLAIGGMAAIPGYIWYSFLSRSFNYSSRVLSIGVKVAVNQLAFTPIFNVYFFGAQALLSGDTLPEAWRRVCNTVPVSFINSCKLWPPITAFSFAFIPFEYRAIFGGVIAVGWQTYLSFLNGRAERLEALRQKLGKEEDTTTTAPAAVEMVPVPAGKQVVLA